LTHKTESSNALIIYLTAHILSKGMTDQDSHQYKFF